MLKTFSELQRAAYYGQAWRVEELLHDGYAINKTRRALKKKEKREGFLMALC